MIRLLLDANLSWRLCNKIADIFPDCIHVSRTDLVAPAADEVIWEWAKANGHILILTNDEDFERLSRLRGFPPKVVLFRTGNQSTHFLANLIHKHQQAIIDLVFSAENGILEIYD